MVADVPAILIGGPLDGQEITVGPEWEQVNAPVAIDMMATFIREDAHPLDLAPFEIDIWRLANCLGRPSLDDRGRRRFTYAGRY